MNKNLSTKKKKKFFLHRVIYYLLYLKCQNDIICIRLIHQNNLYQCCYIWNFTIW